MTAVLLFFPPFALAGAEPEQERLEYTISYRGLFSGFAEIGIAEMSLESWPEPRQIAGQPHHLTSLEVTTENFTKAEIIYPIRLLYRSWLDDRQQPFLASLSYNSGDGKDELIWFDWERQLGHYYVTSGQQLDTTTLPPEQLRKHTWIEDGRWRKLAIAKQQQLAERGVVDYLSLLQQLRNMPLKSGQTLEFAVFSGEKIKHFRVDVSSERLRQAGWNRPALKLDLYEFNKKKQKDKGHIDLWISNDEERLPLLFYAERGFGAIQGLLETGRPLDRTGDALPIATRRAMENYLNLPQ